MKRTAAGAAMLGTSARLAGRAFGADGEIPLGSNAELGGRLLLPAFDPWNRDVSADEVDPKSDAILSSIGIDKPLHEDFGLVWKGEPAGISYVVVGGDQLRVSVTIWKSCG